MKLTKEEMREWVDGYISAQEGYEDRENRDELHWAIQKFLDLEMEHPELCWDAILNILHREPSDKVKGILAAGPLEDLIEYHGPEYIEAIEEEARKTPDFRHLLGGVWESSTQEVWSRVLKARNNISW